MSIKKSTATIVLLLVSVSIGVVAVELIAQLALGKPIPHDAIRVYFSPTEKEFCQISIVRQARRYKK
jgi:hypothetical protein